MKGNTWRLFAFFALVFMVLFSCGKTDPALRSDDAVITGYNANYCALLICSGFYVNLGNDTVKHGPSGYHAIRYPASEMSRLSGRPLPIFIHMVWKPDADSTQNLIDITYLRTR